MTKPARILVTGASGFVGQHLTNELSACFPTASVYVERFDVSNPSAVSAAFLAFQPDACVHLAAIASVPEVRQDPVHTFAVNLGGTLNVAKAILDHVPKCRLVYVDSSESYGGSFRSGVVLDESAPLDPLNVYAASKAVADSPSRTQSTPAPTHRRAHKNQPKPAGNASRVYDVELHTRRHEK